MAKKKAKNPVGRPAKSEPTDIDLRIGAALKRARRGIVPEMSQAAVGDAVGCTGQQIQKYEAGTDRIKLSTFLACCKAMAVLPSAVIREIAEEE